MLKGFTHAKGITHAKDITQKAETKALIGNCLVPRRPSRARKGRREGDNGLHLQSVSFPWSLAAHHQSLASTLRKTKRLWRRLNR